MSSGLKKVTFHATHSDLTYTAHLWSSSSVGWGSWASQLFPRLSGSPHRSMTGRWFSSGAPHTECQCRDRRAKQSCTPLGHAPGSAAELCGISGGYSCCQFVLPAWCRQQHILTAVSRISRTAHSSVLPSNTGFAHPRTERMLLEKCSRRKNTKSCRCGNMKSKIRTLLDLPETMEAIRYISMFLSRFNSSSSYGDTSYSSYTKAKGTKRPHRLWSWFLKSPLLGTCQFFTHLQTSQSSRPWGSVPPCESHADTCKLEVGDNAAVSSEPPGTPSEHLDREVPLLPPPSSTPTADKVPCRTGPGGTSALPLDSPRMETLQDYLKEKQRWKSWEESFSIHFSP